jgi:phytoene dehydrogenase-like protein
MERPRIVIVGAGLAGLGCAVELAANGVECVVLEAADDVGGRVRTDVVDGFRLDRGFQVLLTAYPEAQRLLDYPALDLRRFYPGASIRRAGGFHRIADPWRRPMAGVMGLLRGAVSPVDALRIARLRRRVARSRGEPASPTEELTTARRLEAEGFSPSFINRFFRPFFGGVFLDAELTTSELQLEFVFRMFAAGHIAVPARGMGEIPRQLASRLPEGALRLETPVREVQAGGVRYFSGEWLTAAAVVVAVDGDEAAELIDTLDRPRWRGATCMYFAAESSPLKGPVLLLDGGDIGPINNLCVMSEVAPEYAADARALVSVTVLGVDADSGRDLESDVRRQLGEWFGPSVARWSLLRTYLIDRALPDQTAPHPRARPVRLESGVYICGDHRADSSINGAMASGRRAADAVLADLGRGRP